MHLDFYLSTAAGPGGYGPGKTYLGSIDALTAVGGDATFLFTYAGTLAAHQFITATATDAAGNTSEFSFALGINNPPVASLGGRPDGQRGPGRHVQHRGFERPGFRPAHLLMGLRRRPDRLGRERDPHLPDNGVYTATLIVSDGFGGITAASATITVNNVAPTIAPGALTLTPNTINENDTVALSGTITDPGVLDSETVVIDWGDGSPTKTL